MTLRLNLVAEKGLVGSKKDSRYDISHRSLTGFCALDIECNGSEGFLARGYHRSNRSNSSSGSRRLKLSEAIELLERLEPYRRRKNEEESEMKCIAKGLLAMICAVALGAGMAGAQTYPTKTVRLIIPFPPGGSNDIVGRFIATKLTERIGKQVVADNRGGAGGVIGTEAAAKSEPDGHTILIVSSAYPINSSLYKHPTIRSRLSPRSPRSAPGRTFSPSIRAFRSSPSKSSSRSPRKNPAS